VLKQIINQDEEPKSEDKKKEGSADSSSSSKPSSESKSTSKRSSPMTGSKNILSSDVEIRGKLRFSNDLIIDGRIEGETELTAGENAQIIGDIKTRSVVVFGKVKGNITVTDRCELKQNAELDGDVIASKLAIEEGAIFLGSSSVGKPSSISSKGGGGGKPQDGNSGGEQK
jgi:cytoskeletal protein CcmA (bactofilin family)